MIPPGGCGSLVGLDTSPGRPADHCRYSACPAGRSAAGRRGSGRPVPVAGLLCAPSGDPGHGHGV